MRGKTKAGSGKACVGLGKHAQGFGKHVRAWAAKLAWLGQMGEFLGTQASVARTVLRGAWLRRHADVWRPETVRCAWNAGGREMRTSGRAVEPEAEICGRRGACDAGTWPMTQVAVGAALDRESVQVHSVHSAKNEMAERVGQVAGRESNMCLF